MDTASGRNPVSAWILDAPQNKHSLRSSQPPHSSHPLSQKGEGRRGGLTAAYRQLLDKMKQRYHAVAKRYPSKNTIAIATQAVN